MRKYKVFDIYENVAEKLGYADTMAEIMNIARKRYQETDGECLISYLTLNPDTQKYKISSEVILEVIR